VNLAERARGSIQRAVKKARKAVGGKKGAKKAAAKKAAPKKPATKKAAPRKVAKPARKTTKGPRRPGGKR